MSEEITPKTANNLRSLCRRISAEYNLGWDVQNELYSRMKEQLLGYVSGTEKVTEEEAFLLMRKHFGEPVEIRELLREVHADEARTDFYGRIATLLAATLGLGFVSEILARLLFLGVSALSPGGVVSGLMMCRAVSLGDMLLPPLLLLAGYTFWRGCKEGRRYWFQNTGPYNILTVITLLVVVPELLWNIPQGGLNAFREVVYIPYGYSVSLALQCMVWLLWCDAPPRWRWGTMICPVFWVFYEATLHPLFLAFGLFTSPTKSSILIFDQRFFSLHIPALLRIAAVSFVVYLLLHSLRMTLRKNSGIIVQ